MATQKRTWHPVILAILFLVGSELIAAGQLYTFVPDKLPVAGRANYDVLLKDADSAGSQLAFHVLIAAASPPNETLLRVATFSEHRLSTIDQLMLTGIDATGIGVKLHQIQLGPADVAKYEELFQAMSAIGNSGERIARVGMPFFREAPIGGMLYQRVRFLKIQETDFRLPPPPTVWTWKGGIIGRLDFRLESAGGASIKAVLITTAPEQ